MSWQSKFFAFWASPKGRQVTFTASVSAAMGAFAIHYTPHAFLQFRFREWMASYHQGMERPVSEKLKERVEIAQNLLQLENIERKFVGSFMVSGFDIRHLGSLSLRFGANVGIPINYTYTSSDDIDKGSVIVRGQPVDWTSKGGELLKEALVLKDDEQIFGITREILYMKQKNLILHSIFPASGIFIYYLLTHNINSKLHMFHRPMALRAGLYGICGFLAFGIYAFATDMLEVYTEGKIDEMLTNLGEKFTDAGIRFYDKLLKKNMAIRELTGDQSEYTALGNDNYMLRTKTIPLIIRKGFCEQRKKELYGTKSLTSSEEMLQGADVQMQQPA